MALDHRIQVRRLTIETIFKLVALGLLLSMVPFYFLGALAGLLGIVPLTVNGQLLTRRCIYDHNHHDSFSKRWAVDLVSLSAVHHSLYRDRNSEPI